VHGETVRITHRPILPKSLQAQKSGCFWTVHDYCQYWSAFPETVQFLRDFWIFILKITGGPTSKTLVFV